MNKLSNKLAAGVRKVKAEQLAVPDRPAAAPKAAPAAPEAKAAAKRRHHDSELHPARIWPD
jgi:hypothetical protein